MKTILLIEDNLEMRENTAEILELADYDVISAENGKIGVGLAKKEHPDLIICDIMMPELDGYGVLHILGKNHDTAGIPFIFLTAKAEKSEMRKGMNLGADDYLTKPFEETELLDAIESRLKKAAIVKKEYEKNIEGLNEFFNEARGLEELNKLSEDRKIKTYDKKGMIFMEDSYPNAVYFINNGTVKTFKTNEDGKDYITSLYKKGDYLGYLPLLEETPYTESGMAMEETEIAVIPRDDFLQLMHNNRDVSIKFIKMLANNIKEKEEKLLKLAYGSLRERVAEALLSLQKSYQKKEEQDLGIAISREDLASLVGTATESLIRTLSDFKEEKLVETEGRKIKILDRQGLEHVASPF